MRDDKGLAIVMTAVLMVVLLVMTAFAVDIGAQLAERRQDQTAADSGAMAGIQNVMISADLNIAANDAIATVRTNLPTKYPDLKWNLMWSTCVDPNPGTEFPNIYASSASPCVRFNTGGTRMKVTLPTQLVNAQFSSVIGVKKLESSAMAISQLSYPGGGMLPFAMLNNANRENQLCTAYPADCGGGSSDDLRSLDSPVVGNSQFGTNDPAITSCNVPIDPKSKTTDPKMRERSSMNTAMGVDHNLLRYRAGLPRSDKCGTLFPNHIFWYNVQEFSNDTVNYAAFVRGFSDGLYGSFQGKGNPNYPDGLGPRLTRTNNPTRMLDGVAVDDRPLWDYIPSSLAAPDIPRACERSVIKSDPRDGYKEAMKTCLIAYAGTNDAPIPDGTFLPLFTARSPGTPPGMFDAQISPRFAVLPMIDPADVMPAPSTGSPIRGWKFAFIQTIYSGGGMYNPGGPSNTPLLAPNFTGVSMFQVRDAMLPEEMRGALTANDDRTAVYSLVK